LHCDPDRIFDPDGTFEPGHNPAGAHDPIQAVGIVVASKPP